jgi:hypothetical protein
MNHAIPHVRSAVDPSAPRTVDDLLACDVPTLAFLYRSAKAPAIDELHGDLIGRMLPSPAVNERLQGAMRSLARLSFFPWKGKTFAPRDSRSGEGWNRVLSDRNLWFRFTTSIGRSRAGAFDALHLNYDHPENPFFIRAIQDEVRTVAPGLWLGQAYVVVKKRPWLALYFALEQPR